MREQPPKEHFVELLQRRGVGFEHVSCEVLEFPATLDREWWLDMVGKRFWSTFAHFSDEELT